MSIAEANELSEVLDRVRTWSPESRIVLARRILETLETTMQPSTRGLPTRSVQELIGIGTGDSPPDDQAVRRWIDEHRTEKYG